MNIRKITAWIGLALVSILSLSVINAQDEGTTPSVTVSDQVVTGAVVGIDQVVTENAGFIVIHADNEGAPGNVIGFSPVAAGENNGVFVSIEIADATPVLYAMLHEDTGEAGVYEFGIVEGADGPVVVDESPVIQPFNVAVLSVVPQIPFDNTIDVSQATIGSAGWVVIHADNEGRPGEVVGFAPLEAGTNTDVSVELTSELTSGTVWPMLHTDTGEVGVYEFGQVEGADTPIAYNDTVATMPIWVSPHMQISPQLLIMSDGAETTVESPALIANTVLAENAGWLVVHAAGEEGPGEVIGHAAVEPGLNRGITVELDAENLTTTVFPMLHEDTGEAGVYEFGEVEGADAPVFVNEVPVVFPVDVAPSVDYNDVEFDPTITSLVVGRVLSDQDGWLVIHEDVDGAPGAVLGYTRISAGLSHDVVVPVELDEAPPSVFPMLHQDTDEIGEYEFGIVQEADLPIQVNGEPVTGPAEVEVSQDM